MLLLNRLSNLAIFEAAWLFIEPFTADMIEYHLIFVFSMIEP